MKFIGILSLLSTAAVAASTPGNVYALIEDLKMGCDNSGTCKYFFTALDGSRSIIQKCSVQTHTTDKMLTDTPYTACSHVNGTESQTLFKIFKPQQYEAIISMRSMGGNKYSSNKDFVAVAFVPSRLFVPPEGNDGQKYVGPDTTVIRLNSVSRRPMSKEFRID